MPSLGLSLGLPFGRVSAAAAALPPDTPANFAAVPADQLASLSWDASAGATSYKVYASLADVFGTASEVTESPTIGTELDVSVGLQAGELYYFWVVASNAAGDSAESASDSARPYVTVPSPGNANLLTPAGSWTFGTLFFRSGGFLPALCIVYGSGSGGVSNGDGTWEDDIMGGTLDPNTPISGAFNFNNASGASVTFWDAEP
jgi:hypothetical protein